MMKKKLICLLFILSCVFTFSGCSKQASSYTEVLQNICDAYANEDYDLAASQYSKNLFDTYNVPMSSMKEYVQKRRDRMAVKYGSNFKLSYDIINENTYSESEMKEIETKYGFKEDSITDASFLKVDFYINNKKVSHISCLFICVDGICYICDDEAP